MAALITCGAVLVSATAYACDCSAPPAHEARNMADAVFRGTVVALRPATRPIGFTGVIDTGRVAVFQVSRGWKGDVSLTFEMPAHEEAAACWGFSPKLLRVGNDLLVYAYRMPGEIDNGGTMFETSICSRTALAAANEDLGALGPGYEPGQSPEAKRRRTFYSSAAATAVIGALISYLVQRRVSSKARDSMRVGDNPSL